MGEVGNAYRIFAGNSERIDHLGGLGVDGRIILKRILKKQNVVV
jgi:hypothetical protein